MLDVLAMLAGIELGVGVGIVEPQDVLDDPLLLQAQEVGGQPDPRGNDVERLDAGMANAGRLGSEGAEVVIGELAGLRRPGPQPLDQLLIALELPGHGLRPPQRGWRNPFSSVIQAGRPRFGRRHVARFCTACWPRPRAAL